MDSSSQLQSQPKNYTNQHTDLVIQQPSTPSLNTPNAQSPAAFSQQSLVGLAGKLFSILTELKKSQQAHDPAQLQSYLINELEQFKELATQQGHTEETILIAQFALARSLDEAISSHSWGQSSAWQAKRLTATLNHAESLEANFVDALRKMSEVPEIFIDVLELIYLCQNLVDTNKQNEPLNHELYHIISQQRGEFERKLSKTRSQPREKQSKHFSKMQFGLLAIGILLLLATVYISFNYLLDQSSNELTTSLNQQTLTSPSNTQWTQKTPTNLSNTNSAS